jgi:hypothetical protein
LATEVNSDAGQSTSVGAKSIVIDIEQGLVAMNIGAFPITPITARVLVLQDGYGT